MGNKQFVNFRADDALVARLDAFAKKNQLRRSKAARLLLHDALYDDGALNRIEQATTDFRAAMQRAVSRMVDDIHSNLPLMLEEELGE